MDTIPLGVTIHFVLRLLRISNDLGFLPDNSIFFDKNWKTYSGLLNNETAVVDGDVELS